MSRDRLGRCLVLLRRQRGLTQPELAAAIGVHVNTISKWERGVAMPGMDRLGPLCRALRVRPEVFIDLPLRQVERYFTD